MNIIPLPTLKPFRNICGKYRMTKPGAVRSGMENEPLMTVPVCVMIIFKK